MRADLRLAVITLYAASTVVTIAPFAVYRLASGQILVGLADACIVLVFCILAALAWRPNWTRAVANLLAVVAAAAVIAVVHFLGLSYMWAFSCLVGNFLMADRYAALGINSVMVIVIAFEPGLFVTDTDRATFAAVAGMISLLSIIFASRVDQQRSQLTELAERDGLTGALNRRSLDHDLRSLQAQRDGRSGTHCLVLIDLDDFKHLNDRFGHEAGDRVLQDLTRYVERSTRSSDRFYRYGGEEFVLLLPNTTLDDARQVVTKLSRGFSDRVRSPGGAATFSAGITPLRSDDTVETWLHRADRCLLAAKHLGKNRVEIDPAP
ncbi:GGDEF domain-containing protein [Halomonas denitrificans]|nr:GGDEF domain-containing protein [Halomonas denitrificans]